MIFLRAGGASCNAPGDGEVVLRRSLVAKRHSRVPRASLRAPLLRVASRQKQVRRGGPLEAGLCASETLRSARSAEASVSRSPANAPCHCHVSFRTCLCPEIDWSPGARVKQRPSKVPLGYPTSAQDHFPITSTRHEARSALSQHRWALLDRSESSRRAEPVDDDVADAEGLTPLERCTRRRARHVEGAQQDAPSRGARRSADPRRSGRWSRRAALREPPD